MARRKPEVRIQRCVAVCDPEPDHVFYQVVASTEHGVWPEVFGDEELLNAYLRGLRAGSALRGNELSIGETPRGIFETKRFIEKTSAE